MIGLLIFIIGSVLGSFYLVVATRLPKGEDILISRSHCDKCGYVLKWYNLFPIISYIIQKGRCSHCKEKIDALNIISELVTGLGFLICYLVFGFSYEFFEGLVIVSIAIIIFISDFKYMVILDSPLVIGGILTFGLKVYYFGFEAAFYGLLSGVSLFCVMLLVEQIGRLLFKREALGGGDVKFAFLMGLILEFRLGLVALILSTFLALPYSVASLYLIKNNEVAYGPFLAGALLIVFFLSDKFLLLFTFLFNL